MFIMKRFSMVMSALLLVAVFALPLAASAATSPGIKPGSIFYFFDTAFEKIDIFFTFSPEKKAEKALKYADERLAEAEAVAKDKNTDAVKTAIINYESNIALAQEKSKDVGDKVKAEALLISIADNASKNQEVLTDVLAKVPDEAKGVVEQGIEANKRGQEEATKKIAELNGEVAQLKQEVADLKNNVEIKKSEEKSDGHKEAILKSALITLPTAPSTNSVMEPVISSPAPKESQEESAVTLTNANGLSYTFEDPIINKQKIIDLIESGFSVTRGKLPEGIVAGQPIIAPLMITSETAEPPLKKLEILSVNMSVESNSAHLEWQTNIPAISKLFVLGKVYNSQSGLSTHHIVELTDLISSTNYAYEIEAIAGDQVVKKQDSFSTKLGKIKITWGSVTGCLISDGGVMTEPCHINAMYFEDNVRRDASITIFSKNGGTFTSGNLSGNPLTASTITDPLDGKPIVLFYYTVAPDNIRKTIENKYGKIEIAYFAPIHFYLSANGFSTEEASLATSFSYPQ